LIGQPLPMNAAQMKDTAPLIVGMIRKHYPNSAGGGRLVIGRVTKDRAGFLDAGEIVPPDRATPTFRVPTAGGFKTRRGRAPRTGVGRR
jgi:hypothetical protein